MDFGVTIFATDRSIEPVELAHALEERGLSSLYLPEHTHIPISRRTPPPTGVAELPEEYRRTLDPLVTLAVVSAVTTTLRLGTGIMLAAQREPIVTAKAVATLQNLSGGRVSLGVGFGWNVDEMQDHGVELRTRRSRTREHVLCMQSLWHDDVASFDGDIVHLPPTWAWPKPEVAVPVLMGGGAGPTLFDHIAEYGDGWIPIGGSGLTDAVPRLRDRVAAAGRDPAALKIVPFGSLPTPGKLDHFESIGVTSCVVQLPSAGRDEVLADLDAHVAVLDEWRSDWRDA